MTDSKHFPDFKASLPSMEAKTVAITGTTSGTGKVAAHTMADLGATVIVLNRASERATKALAELTTAYPDAEIHAVECDLQSFESVLSAAEEVRKLCPNGLDVLANNAGVMALPDEATGDGYDVQMQTNHLSHFLLTAELMPLLETAAEATGEARIVNHSSTARLQPSKTLQPRFLEKRGGNLGGESSLIQKLTFSGPPWLRYNQTKLANAAFTAALHHRLGETGSNVKALVAHPGFAATNLQSTSADEGGMSALTNKFTGLISQSAEDGAMGLIAAMADSSARSGQFWGPGLSMTAMRGKAKPHDLEGFYDNPTTRELLWTKSEEAVGREFVID